LDKNPFYTLQLDNVTTFVDRVIFIIRDPEEVVESQMRNWRQHSDRTWTVPNLNRAIKPPTGQALDRLHARWEAFKKTNPFAVIWKVVYAKLGFVRGANWRSFLASAPIR